LFINIRGGKDMKKLKLQFIILVICILFLSSFVSAKTINIKQNLNLKDGSDADLLSIVPEEPDGINDWYVSQPYVFFNPIVGLESIYYRIDNGCWKTYTSPITQDWSDGYHIFEARAFLEGGEEIFDLIEVKQDTTKPQLFSPEIFQTPFSIKTNALDETSGVFRFDFYYDSVYVHTDEEEPFTWNPSNDQIVRGMHTIKTVVFDNAGNINEENVDVWIIKNREINSRFNVFFEKIFKIFFLTPHIPN
jgi:hypothetical protein